MFIVKWFLVNPRLLGLTIVSIFAIGIVGIFSLPRMEDPVLTTRFASITTVFPGATPERIESLVSRKLEQELSDVVEIKKMFFYSRPGVSIGVVELREDVRKQDVQNAFSKVREKMKDAYLLMPRSAFEPEFKEIDAKANVLLAAVKWSHDSPPGFSVLRRLAKRLQEQLDQIPATEKTSLFGDSKEEILVEIDSDKANSLRLDMAEISKIVSDFDVKQPAGRIQNKNAELTLEVSGSMETLTRLQKTPLRRDASGAIVELGDVAVIKRGTPDPPSAKAIVSGLPAVVVGAHVMDSYRIDRWNQEAMAVLESFRKSLPSNVELDILFNQTPYVDMRIRDVLNNFFVGILAIVLITWIFLGWRSSLVVGATLPLACCLVVGCLMVLGIPIHQMSLTGLIIAMGLLIDNAIVVADEIERKVGENKPLQIAILESCSFLVVPLIGSTLTTVFSFAPIALMPGSTGEFVGSIAITTIVAITVSVGLSLTIVPAMAQFFLKRHVAGRNQIINPFRIPEFLFRNLLGMMLRVPRLSCILFLIVPIMGWLLALKLEDQFFPPAERDQFQIQLELAANANISETESMAREIRQIAMQDARIKDVHWFLGESAPSFYYNVVSDRSNMPNYGQAIVQCHDKNNTRSTIEDLQRQVSERFPEAHCVVRQLEQGPPFAAPIEVLLYGQDLQKLRLLGQDVRRILSQTPSVTHTRSELEEVVPKAVFDVDESAAYMAGYDPSSIARSLAFTLDGITGGTVQEGTEEVPIRVRLSQSKRSDLNEVFSLSLQERLPGTRESHQGVPLSAISNIKLAKNTGGITRYDSERCNEIQAFIQSRVLPSTVLNDFNRRLKESGFQLPEGYRIEFGGAAGEQQEAVGNLLAFVILFGLALVVTLVLSLSSFRLALLVGVVAGASVGFSTMGLYFAGLPFGFMAILGSVGMLGVAVNDSLLVLASIQADRRARMGSLPRLVDLLVENARHVVLTTATTVAGFLPLFLAGGEFWPPVAICISCGVVGATFLALFFVPCGYLAFHRFPFSCARSRTRLPSEDAFDSDYHLMSLQANRISH